MSSGTDEPLGRIATATKNPIMMASRVPPTSVMTRYALAMGPEVVTESIESAPPSMFGYAIGCKEKITRLSTAMKTTLFEAIAAVLSDRTNKRPASRVSTTGTMIVADRKEEE